jgi:predicted enzyme related to lactoylglutathione lyase
VKQSALARVVLNVVSLERATAFYTQALGMRRVATQSGVIDAAAEDAPLPARVLLSFPNQPANAAVLELRTLPVGLTQRGSTTVFDKIAVSVPDLGAAAERVAASAEATGGALTKPPFAVPGVGTRVALVADPDGHTLALVDANDFEAELK